MPDLNITCSKCGAEFLIDEAHAGSTVACSSCNSTILVPLAGIKAGMKLADFEIVKRLGVGGMGEVWLANQVSMDRDVALKILSPALTADEEFVTRFTQEVKMAGKLTHPNIVGAHYAGVDSGVHFLAISYVDGVELENEMKMQQILPEEEALRIAKSIAQALKYAWDEFKILHRDIKPSNIMISSKGVPMLMDMGISKSLAEDKNLTMTGMVVGTPYYMSPEQCRADGKLDFRADLYSLGATLYHMVTGTVPYDATNATGIIAKQITEPFPSPRERNSEISEGCEILLEIMMAKHAEERQTSWDDLIRDIDLVLEGKPPQTQRPALGMSNVMQPGYEPRATTDARSSESEEKSSKVPLIIGALVTLLVLMGVVMVVMLLGKQNGKDSDQNINKPPPSRQPAKTVKHPPKPKVQPSATRTIPKATATLPKLTSSTAKIPADLTKRIQEARTKTGPILKVNPKNWQEKIKELKPGMVLHFEKGAYGINEKKMIKCDKVIVQADKGTIFPLFSIDGDNLILRNMHIGGLGIKRSNAKVTIIDSRISSLNSGRTDMLAANCIFGSFYAWGGKAYVVNSTIVSGADQYGNSTPVTLTQNTNTFLQCVIYGKENALLIDNRQKKPTHLFDSVVYGNKYLVAIAQKGKSKPVEYFHDLAKASKWVIAKNCILKRPDFADYAKGDYRLKPNTPGQGTALNGGNLGANINASGFPVPFEGQVSTISVTKKLEGPLAKKLHAALMKANPDYNEKGEIIVENGKIVSVNLYKTGIKDIRPLQGLPLKYLDICHNQITDISPIKGMPLEGLRMFANDISDISAIKGMPLKKLFMDRNFRLKDISPIKGMKLTYLTCGRSSVTDISAVKGMPLDKFSCWHTPGLKSLEPLRGMPIQYLMIGEGFGKAEPMWSNLDLSPLEDCEKLITILLPMHPKNPQVLKDLPQLKEITIPGKDPQTPKEFFQQLK